MRLSFLAILLASCTYSDATRNIAVGGKGAYNSGTFAVTWDNEKSFNDVAWVAMAAVPAVQAVKIAKSDNALSAINSNNAAKTTINASNNATKIATDSIAADVTKTITKPK